MVGLNGIVIFIMVEEAKMTYVKLTDGKNHQDLREDLEINCKIKLMR
jgi:hypothetical protein